MKDKQKYKHWDKSQCLLCEVSHEQKRNIQKFTIHNWLTVR